MAGELDCGDGFRLIYHNVEDWKGRGGVGILLSPVAECAWRTCGQKVFLHPSGRVMTCSFQLAGSEGLWHAVVGYGPASRRGEEKQVQRERAAYLVSIQECLKTVKNGEFYIVAADMNCRVGRRTAAEVGYRHNLGLHGIGCRNKAGDDMLDFCVQQRLAVANSFFQHDLTHTATWYHPYFRYPAVLDYALVRRGHLGLIEDVKAFPGLDIDSDHSLVVVRLVACPWGTNKMLGRRVTRDVRLPRTELGWPENSAKWSEFKGLVQSSLNTAAFEESADLGHMCEVIRDCAEATLGSHISAKGQWRIGHEQDLAEIARTRTAAWKKLRSAKTRSASQTARKEYNAIVKQSKLSVRQFVNGWWSSRMEKVQQAADSHNSHELFNDLQQLLAFIGLESSKSALALDANAMRQSMTGHFSKIFATKRPVNWEAVHDAPKFTLDVNWDAPMKPEVRAALLGLKNHKAPGADGVEAELLKLADLATTPEAEPGVKDQNTGGKVVDILTRALGQWWHAVNPDDLVFPDSWLEAIMIALYKGKGERSDMNNWRGIWLLSICSKIACVIINTRLQALGEKFWFESMVGFRRFRGCADASFTLRRIVEEFRNTFPEGTDGTMDPGLYVLFIDLAKAFDSVPRDVLWYLLEEKLGIPPPIVRFIRKFHDDLTVKVYYQGELGEPFPTGSGVRQGCIMVTTLWNIYFYFVMSDWRTRCTREFGEEHGVQLRTTYGVPFESRARVQRRFGGVVSVKDLE